MTRSSLQLTVRTEEGFVLKTQRFSTLTYGFRMNESPSQEVTVVCVYLSFDTEKKNCITQESLQ